MKDEIKDEYHTMQELYHHRFALFIALAQSSPSIAWRSRKHADDTPMYKGYFIAGMSLPIGDISYHLPDRLWDLMKFADTLDKAPIWDDHDSLAVINRLFQWIGCKNEGMDIVKKEVKK